MSKAILRSIYFLPIAVMCVALFGAALIPVAKADEFDQRTVVTIDRPTEIPGMVLAPGTYVFKLFDSNAERKVVQVYKDGHLIASFLGFPIYHATPARRTVVSFTEASSNSPQRLHEWFYQRDNFGLVFKYEH
jgi:hypothetical protein